MRLSGQFEGVREMSGRTTEESASFQRTASDVTAAERRQNGVERQIGGRRALTYGRTVAEELVMGGTVTESWPNVGREGGVQWLDWVTRVP